MAESLDNPPPPPLSLDNALQGPAIASTASYLGCQDLLALSSCRKAFLDKWAAHITTLSISEPLTATDPATLSSLVRRLAHLSALTIKGPDLLPPIMKGLTDEENGHLQQLNILPAPWRGALLDLTHVLPLADAIGNGQLPSLTELSVEKVIIGDQASEALAASFGDGCPQLTSINFSGIILRSGMKTAEVLGSALETRRAKGWRDLTKFVINGALGAIEVPLAAIWSPSLKELTVNHLDTSGLVVLIDLFTTRDAPGLEKLRVSIAEPLDARDEASMLVSVLAAPGTAPNLKALDLDDTVVGPQAEAALREKMGTVWKGIDLHWEPCDDVDDNYDDYNEYYERTLIPANCSDEDDYYDDDVF